MQYPLNDYITSVMAWLAWWDGTHFLNPSVHLYVCLCHPVVVELAYNNSSLVFIYWTSVCKSHLIDSCLCFWWPANYVCVACTSVLSVSGLTLWNVYLIKDRPILDPCVPKDMSLYVTCRHLNITNWSHSNGLSFYAVWNAMYRIHFVSM